MLIITSLESGAARDSFVQIDLGKRLNADLFPFSEAICELFGPGGGTAVHFADDGGQSDISDVVMMTMKIKRTIEQK